MSGGISHLQAEALRWTSAHFPNQTVLGKIEHLRSEVNELHDAPEDGEEMADCLLLLLDIASHQGVDLMDEAWKKLEKNKLRQWGKPDELGVIRHVGD